LSLVVRWLISVITVL